MEFLKSYISYGYQSLRFLTVNVCKSEDKKN